MKLKNISVKEADEFVLGGSTPEFEFVTNVQKQRDLKPPYLELNVAILKDRQNQFWGFWYSSINHNDYKVETDKGFVKFDDHNSDKLVKLQRYERKAQGYEYKNRKDEICYKPGRAKMLDRLKKGYKVHYKYSIPSKDIWVFPQLKESTVVISNQDATTLRNGGQTDDYVYVDQCSTFDFDSGLSGEPATIVRDNDGYYWSFVWIVDSLGNVGYMSQHHIFHSGDGVMLYSEPDYEE